MRKKKEKSFTHWIRLLARVGYVSLPAGFILVLLVAVQKISPLTAILSFLGFFVFAGVIVLSVFQELERFIAYLKTLAQGIEIEPPRFNKGIFSSGRLAETFQSVKKKWFEQTLSDSRILEHLPDPLIMADQAGIIVFMNQKARSVFGDNLMKKDCWRLFNTDKIRKVLTAVLSGQTATEWLEWSWKDMTFQMRVDRLPAATRNGAVVVMTLNDITPFKRFREQQAEFFANASHELKTPLSIISGFVETLQGPAKDDPDARETFLNMMADQTRRMTGLVQDLLRLAKQQSLSEENRRDIVLIPDLVRGVAADLKNKAVRGHKTIEIKTDCDIPRLIGNRGELRHVFQNLIDNAIKYGQEHSVITIRIGLKNGLPDQDERPVVFISVHNIGNPIESKHLDKLFDRFYRVDSVLAKQVGGTGLGLSIVQQIVHEHDGMIEVESTHEKGTTFTVYLPLDL